jgi:hypothetical protein
MEYLMQKLCLSMLLLLVLSGVAQADTAVLTWNANPESDLAGYKVYQGTISGQYGPPVTLGTVTTYTMTLPQLAVDTIYFWALTAYDTAGNESVKSAPVSKLVAGVIVAPLLAGPTNVTFANMTFTYTLNPSATSTKLYVHEAALPYDWTLAGNFAGLVTGTSKTVAMKWNTAYDCWLRSVNSDGVEGPPTGVACSTGPAPVTPPLDTDADGVPDSLDQCPTVPGPATNNGCPVVPPPPPTGTTATISPAGEKVVVQCDPAKYLHAKTTGSGNKRTITCLP